LPPDEVADIGEVVEWVTHQQWCDGRVPTTGTSYTADTTFMSLVAARTHSRSECAERSLDGLTWGVEPICRVLQLATQT
jgi:predicted acyl esterase